MKSSIGLFLEARTGQNAFSLLGSMCAQQASTISGFGVGTYVCRCHGSQFDTSGRVLGGPAPFSPPPYTNGQFANNILTVTV